jgi:hypothetical protein
MFEMFRKEQRKIPRRKKIKKSETKNTEKNTLKKLKQNTRHGGKLKWIVRCANVKFKNVDGQTYSNYET